MHFLLLILHCFFNWNFTRRIFPLVKTFYFQIATEFTTGKVVNPVGREKKSSHGPRRKTANRARHNNLKKGAGFRASGAEIDSICKKIDPPLCPETCWVSIVVFTKIIIFLNKKNQR